MEITSDSIGKLLSFSVYPSAILGTVYTRVKVLAILDAETAFQYIDPASLHANVYPTLPQGVPDQYDGYLYAKLRLQNGAVTCIGLPWIDASTVVEVADLQYLVTVSNVNAGDFERIRTALVANGFPSITIVPVWYPFIYE